MTHSDSLPLSGSEQISESQTSLKQALEIIGKGENPEIVATGSYFILGDTNAQDIDLVFEYTDRVSAELQSAGFVISPHEEYPNESIAACYRKDRVNIIAVRTKDDLRKWLKATQLAIVMELKEKFQRVALFQFITEGKVRGHNIYYNNVSTPVEEAEVF